MKRKITVALTSAVITLAVLYGVRSVEDKIFGQFAIIFIGIIFSMEIVPDIIDSLFKEKNSVRKEKQPLFTKFSFKKEKEDKDDMKGQDLKEKSDV